MIFSMAKEYAFLYILFVYKQTNAQMSYFRLLLGGKLSLRQTSKISVRTAQGGKCKKGYYCKKSQSL